MKKKKRKRKTIEPRTPYVALHENFILDQAGCLLCPLFKFCVKDIEDFPEYECKSKKWQKADHVVNSHCIPPRIRNKNKDGSVDVLFIGEAPGYNEDVKGKVFVGKAGQELDKYLELYKIKSYAIDNTMKCRPPNNDTPTYTAAKLCSPFLAETIQRLQPKVIVPMGTPAMQMVTANQHARIMKSVGRVSTVTLFKEKQTFPIFPIFHPSFILRQPHRQEEYVSLFHRLKLLLDNPKNFRGTDDFDILVVHDRKTLKKAKEKLAKVKEGIVAFDVETTDLSAHFVKPSEKLKVRTPSKILSIGFAFDNESAISFLLSHDHVHINVINEARTISTDILTSKKFKKIAHNLKFDYEYVQKLWGIRIKAAIGDTMLMHYAGIKEDKGTHGLKHLSAEYLNIQEYETEVTSQARDERQHKRVVNFENVDPIILGKYNAMDVIVTYQLYHALKVLIKEREKELRKMKYRGNKKQLIKVLVKAAKAIADMEMSGMYIDTEAGKMLQKYYEVLKNESEFKLLHHPKVVKFKKMLREKYGVKKSGVNKGDVKMEFKINSPKQLTELLFSDVYFGLTPVAPTGTGEKWIKNKLGLSRVGIQEFLEVCDEMPIQYMSTDKEAFEEIKAMQKKNKGVKILTHIDDYKGHAKLLSTYILPFMERARTCRGKMHSTFNLHITDTGRLCIAGDTILETSVGSVFIKDLDLTKDSECFILTHKGRLQRISAKYYKGKELMYEVKTLSRKNIKCTQGHIFHTRNGWLPLRSLKIGDTVLTIGGGNDCLCVPRQILRNNIKGSVSEISKNEGYCRRMCFKNGDKPHPILSFQKSMGEKIQNCVKKTSQRELYGSIKRQHTQKTKPTVGYFGQRRVGVITREKTRNLQHSKNDAYDCVSCTKQYEVLWYNRARTRRSMQKIPTSPKVLCRQIRTILPGYKREGEKFSQKQRRFLQLSLRSVLKCIRPQVCYKGIGESTSICSRERSSPSKSCNISRQSWRNDAICCVAKTQNTAYQTGTYWKIHRGLSYWKQFSSRSRRRLSQKRPYNDKKGQKKKEKDKKSWTDNTKVYRERGNNEFRRLCRKSNFTIQDDIITSITPIGIEDVWDISVENDCSYVAHGFINHNSAEKPNFQNIPSIHGINVKRMITSRWKDKGVIVSVDYSQIELRLLAIFSGDKGMLTSYKNDEDLHKKTALGITNKTLMQYNALEKAIQKKWRIVAKRVNFGIAYGIGGDGIVRNLNKEGIRLSKSKDPLEAREQSIIKARKYIKTFYTLYPEAKEYIDDTQEFVERYGYIASIFGRTRNLPEVWSTDNEEASRALRQAVNFTIQSAASDIMLTSLILVNKIVKKRFKKDVKIIASIHDAIDFDAKIDVVPDLLETVVEVMENVPKYAEKVWGKDFDWSWFYTIPIYADAEVGVNWRDCIELNDLPKKYKNAPLDKKVEVAIELSRGLQHKYDEEMKGMK